MDFLFYGGARRRHSLKGLNSQTPSFLHTQFLDDSLSITNHTWRTYNHRSVLISTTTTSITFKFTQPTTCTIISSPALNNLYVNFLLGVPCLFFVQSLYVLLRFFYFWHFLSFLSIRLDSVRCGGVLACPTFVCRIAVSHASYLPNTVVIRHVSFKIQLITFVSRLLCQHILAAYELVT